MRSLCFGGSFNPVHNAHLGCSLAAAKSLQFDRVLLIPSHQPVLKSKSYDLAPAEHRLAMLVLACESMKSCSVDYDIDPIELTRDGPTYTIDTVNALTVGGGQKIDWLIGADQLLNLHRWHRFEELMRKTQFWIMQRPGYPIDWSQVDDRARLLNDHVVDVPQYDISATQIRESVREGKPIDAWVPANVRQYILTHRLFIP